MGLWCKALYKSRCIIIIIIIIVISQSPSNSSNLSSLTWQPQTGYYLYCFKPYFVFILIITSMTNNCNWSLPFQSSHKQTDHFIFISLVTKCCRLAPCNIITLQTHQIYSAQYMGTTNTHTANNTHWQNLQWRFVMRLTIKSSHIEWLMFGTTTPTPNVSVQATHAACIKSNATYQIYTAKLLFHQSPTRHGDYTVTGQ